MQKNLLFTLLLTTTLLFSCTLSKKEHVIAEHPLIDSVILNEKIDTLTLLFVGDIMQHFPQITAAKQPNGSYDYADCFKYITKEIKSADLAIANLETTLGNNRFSGYPMFCAPKDLAKGLKDAGFNFILTANNHSLDRFSTGVQLTIETLDSLKLPHIGTYTSLESRNDNYPYYYDWGKERIAFYNYTYGTNGLKVSPPTIINLIDTIQIQEDFKQAKANGATINIVCIHWGDEYFNSPNSEQKRLGRWLLQHGATHVIGSHPHVIQPIEVVEDSITLERNVIAYSLGNFISNMSKPHTDGGLMLKLQIFNNHSFLTTEVSYTWVWVGRPNQTKEKNYILYPSSYSTDSLNNISKATFLRYKSLADKVMKHNHKAVKPYFID